MSRASTISPAPPGRVGGLVLERRDQVPADDGTSPDGLIPLACNEIQRLFTTLITQPVRDTAHRLRWSTWRRRTKPAPATATTSSKPLLNHEDHDLQPEH